MMFFIRIKVLANAPSIGDNLRSKTHKRVNRVEASEAEF